MSRYIDADALIEKFKAEHDWSSVYIVEDMPTADVVEVVHGENIGGGFQDIHETEEAAIKAWNRRAYNE